MVKKKELEEILASSPDLVEVRGDVNILELAPGHLSQDEDNNGNNQEELQKRLEVEAKKLTEKINMKKEKIL